MAKENGLSGWKLDAGQEGHRILFRDYQKAIVDLLVENPKTFWATSEVWGSIIRKGVKISRASVIFYLNFLVRDGLAEVKDATGKGGHHKLYRISKSWDEVKKHIAINVILKLGEGLDIELDWITSNLR